MKALDHIASLFARGTPIDDAIRRGAELAVELHRREGRPLVVWREGRVAWIDPFTFEEVPEPAFATNRGNDVA